MSQGIAARASVAQVSVARLFVPPVFVLIHSSSVGPSTWEPVAGALRARRHVVEVPSMLGFVEDGPPYADSYLRRASAALGSLPPGAPIVLIGHSNAELFLPAIAEPLAPRGVSFIFADASIPPIAGADRKDPTDTADPADTAGTADPPAATNAPLVPEAFLDQLRAMAVDGILPRWGNWWPDDITATLYPDTATRERVAAQEPELPIAFYEESVIVPARWSRRPCAYLRFSDAYEAEADKARRLHWPTLHVAGEHLHMLVDPTGVANGICDLAEKLNPGIAPQES